jgi:hypothetical protein
VTALGEKLVERRRLLELELEEVDRLIVNAPCPMHTRVQRLYEQRLRIKRQLRELEGQLVGGGDTARAGRGGRPGAS